MNCRDWMFPRGSQDRYRRTEPTNREGACLARCLEDEGCRVPRGENQTRVLGSRGWASSYRPLGAWCGQEEAECWSFQSSGGPDLCCRICASDRRQSIPWCLWICEDVIMCCIVKQVGIETLVSFEYGRAGRNNTDLYMCREKRTWG